MQKPAHYWAMPRAEGLETSEDGAQQQEVGHWGKGGRFTGVSYPTSHLLSLLPVYREVIAQCYMILTSRWAQKKGHQELWN